MSSVNLAFEEHGDSSNPALIILHGFFASSRNWRQIANRLAEQYHIYLLDLRNHGVSPHSPEMDYQTMSGDLELFMEVHNMKTVSLLGHSMGGKVAMWFALNHPEMIQDLIVADISPVSYQHSFDKTIQALKAIPLGQISNRKHADDFLSKEIPELSYRQFLLQNLQLTEGQYSWRINLDIFYQTADNIISFPATESIPFYKENVMFIMGENSNYLNKKAIDACFPNAVISSIKDANHWLHVEKPEEFCKLVNDFLEK